VFAAREHRTGRRTNRQSVGDQGLLVNEIATDVLLWPSSRLARVVFVDASVPADGEPFISTWPDGGTMMRASIAENGGFWPVAPAAHYKGHGLTDEQITRIVVGSTPHPGAALTEPAAPERPLADALSATRTGPNPHGHSREVTAAPWLRTPCRRASRALVTATR
jgi:hypothetical protein